MRNTVFLLCLLAHEALAQINPQHVTIVRDSFGVPHVYGRTDADAAYGLAWAHSEDDFKSIQQNLLAARGYGSRVLGQEGLLFDFAVQFFGIDTLVTNRYEKTFSPAFKKILSAYAQGINDYARSHPKEVLVKRALPFTPADMVRGSAVTLTLFAGGGMALRAIRENKIEQMHEPNERGSNSMAVAPTRTDDGRAWLLVNSHQPLEGRFAWYEAHIKSDEGWDMIGGLFPGSATIYVGSNRYLGWAHTNNYHNFGDVYKLQHTKRQYLYDGDWKDFTFRTARLRIKVAGVRLQVKKKIRVCDYGPVMETKHGWYALRYPAANDLRAPEQWFRMNKATSFTQFEEALKMEALPLFNTMYADVTGNIFYESGGMIPLRDTALNWQQPIISNSSRHRWTDLVPYARKPRLANPACGYLFSCNQTPLRVSGPGCEWRDSWSGLQQFNNNRGERFAEMFEAIPGKISWQDFRAIKYDKAYADSGSYARNFSVLYTLDEKTYPDIADIIGHLKGWDLRGDSTSTGAAVAFLVHEQLAADLDRAFAFLLVGNRPVTEAEAVRALRKTKKFMLRTYGTLTVPLGEIQRHTRGTVSLSASGMRDVARAADAKPLHKKRGLWRVTNGDGYHQFTKFGSGGVEIFSVTAYGASSNPASRHYTDQMKMFTAEKLKPMTFDWEKIKSGAERIYHPAE